ncbi:3210_t:CDS:2 [Entrophospora sp. SA101]|nr:3210_t:CDS:2 [Entrophospora sp. SA101]
MTSLAIEKIKTKHPEGSYNFIEEGNELCHEHYMKIVESDIHEKYQNKSLEIAQTTINDLSGESESRKDELDWTRIKINLVDDNVILSKDDFRGIITHINNLELQINENSYYIDECNDDFDVINEISNDVNEPGLEIEELIYQYIESDDEWRFIFNYRVRILGRFTTNCVIDS